MALSANTERVIKGTTRIVNVPVAADAVIFQGALVAANASGYLVEAADTSSFHFLGIAMESCDNTGGSAGDIYIKVLYHAIVFIPNSSATVAWIGVPVYATADDTVATSASSINSMGRCVGYDSDGSQSGKGEGVWIDMSYGS